MERAPDRVAGTAVFLTADASHTPAAFLHNLKHNKVLHERIIMLQVETMDVPRVPDSHRVEVERLGKGFHTIKSIIAIGSGGVSGKGWLKGTQTHLEFIPEKHTDFIFAVYSEEFGLVGNGFLLFLYLLLIIRGLFIAANAGTLFGRLLAGSITLIFFTYAFVNMGMVSGILPVVGVPLPLISYGGTALVTLGMGIGILMSIARQKRFVQT